MSQQKGFAFDVGTVLGIGTPDFSSLPEAKGDIVLRVTGELSLVALRDARVGRRLMDWKQQWYEKYDWSREEIPPGTYRLRVPIPGSCFKFLSEQKQLLHRGESAAPVTLVAAALLCMKCRECPDPLAGRWTRCAESTSLDYGVVLTWTLRRLSVSDDWEGYGDCELALSSCRRLPDPCPSSS